MSNCIQLKKSNCKNCYKCIRHCPVKSIKFTNNQAHIVEDECILCGMCFVACPQNAKQIRNDVERAKELLATGKEVYVSVAPAFAANYAGVHITAFAEAMKNSVLPGWKKRRWAQRLSKQNMSIWLQTVKAL